MAVKVTKIISRTAGSTFADADKFKAVGIDSSGNAILYHTALGATGGKGVVGTLDSVTSTTGSAGSQAVGIQVGPVVQLFMSGSTLAAGNLITISTDDSHGVVATTNEPFGVVLNGTSGTTGRIFTVARS
jgi:hypothetical protein